MDALLKRFDQLSYKNTGLLAVAVTLLLLLPVFLIVLQNQTQLVSKAGTILPTPTPLQKTYGALPKAAPVITTVHPWVGKAGDTILIEGKNFGTNPPNSTIAIGNILVDERAISQWTDTRIELTLPPKTISGSTLQLRIGTHAPIESIPLVFYDTATTMRLHKTGNTISSDTLTGTIEVISWTMTGQTIQRKTTTITTKGETALLTLSTSEKLLSLILRDAKGSIISYVVNPLEFGF